VLHLVKRSTEQESTTIQGVSREIFGYLMWTCRGLICCILVLCGTNTERTVGQLYVNCSLTYSNRILYHIERSAESAGHILKWLNGIDIEQNW